MSGSNNRINNSSWPILMTPPILLSPSDLAALSTVGKLLIPPAGLGFANIPFLALCESSAGTGYSGSSTVGFANGSNTNITASTLFLGLAGAPELCTTNIAVVGATVATYANLNNQGIYLLGGSIAAGGTQTVKLWVKYYIQPLV